MDQNCNKCGKTIKHGSAYVAITREVEAYENNSNEREEVVNVIDAELVLVFCTTCGNALNADKKDSQ